MKVLDLCLVFLALDGIQAWTVLQELNANQRYSIFLEWLSVETQSNLGDSSIVMTVFVPTNEAIHKFLKMHPILRNNSSWLVNIAEHYVVHGNFDLVQLKDKESVVTGGDFPKLWIGVKNESIYINNAKIAFSMEAFNGHVHELDAVIYPLGQPSTLKEEIGFGEDFSGLKYLLTKSTEAGDLLHDATAKFTVFSPNPKAVTEDIKAMNGTQLLPLIRRHLIENQVVFSTVLFFQSTSFPTLEHGARIKVEVMDNNVFVGSGGYWSMVESFDVSTTNGVIHVINGVLGLTSGVNVYQALGLFGSSKFRKTLMISELAELMKDLIDNAKMFTVFSPQNTAWDKVSISEKFTMKKILKRHVLTGKLTADALMNRTEVFTLGGEKLAVRTENGSVYLEFDNVKAEVTSTDNMASNGIIHIIDKALTLADRQTSVDITSTAETKETLSTSTGTTETKETLSTSTGRTETNETFSTPTDFTSLYNGVGLGSVVFVLLGLIVLLGRRMSTPRNVNVSEESRSFIGNN